MSLSSYLRNLTMQCGQPGTYTGSTPLFYRSFHERILPLLEERAVHKFYHQTIYIVDADTHVQIVPYIGGVKLKEWFETCTLPFRHYIKKEYRRQGIVIRWHQMLGNNSNIIGWAMVCSWAKFHSVKKTNEKCSIL